VSRTISRWRAAADYVVRETLADLGPNATDKQKRAALREAYPFAQRTGAAYRQWLESVRAALGPRPKPPDPPKPAPQITLPDGIDPTLGALVLALAADLADAVTQNAILDWLEETGDGRAAEARALTPDPEDVARRMHPGGRASRGNSGKTALFHANDGTGLRFPLSRVADDLAGKYLLRDPQVHAAARVVRGRMLLALVLGEGGAVARRYSRTAGRAAGPGVLPSCTGTTTTRAVTSRPSG
jgi:hypothetical protein